MNIKTPGLTRLSVALLLAGAVITFSALRSGPIHAAAAQAVPAASRACGGVGTYGYTGFGTVFPGNALGFPAGTASTNGTITFDQNGHWTVHEVEVGDGQVTNPSATFGGTFTVNPDCTFTADLPPLPGTALVGVFVDNGKQIRAMLTIPGIQVNYLSTVKIHP